MKVVEPLIGSRVVPEMVRLVASQEAADAAGPGPSTEPAWMRVDAALPPRETASAAEGWSEATPLRSVFLPALTGLDDP